MSDVDSPQVTAIEWFYGYGGNSLGLHRVIDNLRVIAACEIEGYAVANLVAKAEGGWVDPIPCWSDCKTFPCEIFRGRIDLFIASYPCQGFSAAGKREGKRDSRFLWPWVFRAVVIIRPRRVFLENVEGHVSLGLSTVISDLEEAGYRCAFGLFSAEECGAPHRRKRVFILAELADSNGERRQQITQSASGYETANWGARWHELESNGDHEPECASEAADDPAGSRRDATGQRATAVRKGRQCVSGEGCGSVEHTDEPRPQGRSLRDSGRADQRAAWPPSSPFPPGPSDLDAWREVLEIDPTLKPALCGLADERPFRVDELRLAGNGCVPATVALAYRTLYERLKR